MKDRNRRRRQRQQQARRQQALHTPLQQPTRRAEVEDLESAETRAPEQPGLCEEEGNEQEQEEAERHGQDSLAAVRACDLRDGLRLRIQNAVTKHCLEAFEDGQVDFNGGLEASTEFAVQRSSVGLHETVVSLKGVSGQYLRCTENGTLDCCGLSVEDKNCRFSFVDVVAGVVLFLGPLGTGHVRVELGQETARATREAAPQGFRLLLPLPACPAGPIAQDGSRADIGGCDNRGAE